MPKTILMTFENDDTRDRFLSYLGQHVKDLSETQDTLGHDVNILPILRSALNSVRLDPPIKSTAERVAALFVAGQKMSEGPLANIMKSFEAECANHSAYVAIKELQNGEWVTIRDRKKLALG